MIAFRSISADVTAQDDWVRDVGYLIDTTNGDVTIDLPTASLYRGHVMFAVHLTAANNALITTQGSETISGQASWTSPTQYDVISLVSDGSNWITLSVVGDWQ